MTRRSLVFQAETLLPTEFGRFRFRVYENHDGQDVVAIATSDLHEMPHIPVRIHSACFTAEAIGSLKCDCKQQLDFALDYIAKHGGVVIYLPQEGRGIGLGNKIRAYALQEDGHDTIEANSLLGLPIDSREYDDALDILKDLDIQSLLLITNNPEKLKAMSNLGVHVDGRIPVQTASNLHSHGYLETKRERMGHLFNGDELNANSLSLLSNEHTGNKKRPFVHVNFAISKTGNLDDNDANDSNTNENAGQQTNISCEKDWQRVHELRERYSAVVVGANTWINDSPQLTVREERLGRQPQRQPDRVIFSGSTACALLPDALLKNCRRSFIIGLNKAKSCDSTHIASDSWDLKKPLESLLAHNVDSLLVEGGMTLLKSFISQNMVDRYTIYVATASLDDAAEALGKHFPELTVSNMHAVPMGEGILLSYSTSNSTSNSTDNCTNDNPSSKENQSIDMAQMGNSQLHKQARSMVV